MASVKDVNIIDVKKKLSPDKHYVYLLAVNYSDSTFAIIRRRYSQFFNFQCALLDKFPTEGRTKCQERIIPYLPGKILFGRSHVKKVALGRVKSLEEYSKAIISLPADISQCELVVNFFRPSKNEICSVVLPKNDSASTISSISAPYLPDELKVLEDYEAKSKTELTLDKGMTVEAIERNASGWWLVRLEDQVGWVPSTYLKQQKQERDLQTKVSVKNYYITHESYVAKNSDELSFLRGTIMEILSRNENGWWLARYKDKQGLVPKVYLEKYDKIKLKTHTGDKHVKFDIDIKSHEQEKSKNAVLKRCKALANFKPESSGYVQFNAGSEVDVLSEDPSGWSYVSVPGAKGWAPSTYLQIISDDHS